MLIFKTPLRGDGSGNFRIQVVGNTGTGKTTLGAYLSAKLNLPHISLDELAWKPGWQRTETDEFKEKVSTFMAKDTRGWVIDGHYNALGMLIPDGATDILWLDPPLHRYLPRLLWRTLMRLLGLRPPCAQGCRETWAEVFSKRGIVWWCITNHAVARTKYRAWLVRLGVDVQGGGKMRRMDGSRRELARWKDDLDECLRRM